MTTHPRHPPANAIRWALACAICAAPAAASPGPFAITRHVIAAGGGYASAGPFAVISTLGESAAGPAASGGAFAISPGFLGAPPAPPACYPDCNDDGALTVSDFGCFQTKFVLGDPYADCNTDGAFTVADFGCFQTAFVVGCP